MKRARILLADDHALMLDGLSNLLTPRFSVVGVVTDGKALVEAAIRLQPELVIMDITMPVMNGIEAAREIKNNFLKRSCYS
jgi:DNA-binding NarL/FixJ family response regulator